jgi:hypothetical protein
MALLVRWAILTLAMGTVCPAGARQRSQAGRASCWRWRRRRAADLLNPVRGGQAAHLPLRLTPPWTSSRFVTLVFYFLGTLHLRHRLSPPSSGSRDEPGEFLNNIFAAPAQTSRRGQEKR